MWNRLRRGFYGKGLRFFEVGREMRMTKKVPTPLRTQNVKALMNQPGQWVDIHEIS